MADELIQGPGPDSASDQLIQGPGPDSRQSSNAGWQPTQYGFNVKPTTTFNGKPSVQRSDSAVWYGPEQGNTGKPGWFDARGNRMGDVPGSQASWLDRQYNQVVQRQQHPIQSAISDIGNTPLMPTPASLIRQTGFGLSDVGINPNGGLGTTARTINEFAPDPTIAGAAKGLVDIPLAPAQFIAHLARSQAMDPAVNAVNAYYQKNFVPSKSGEMIGQTVPFIISSGATGLAEVPEAASALGKLGSYFTNILGGGVKGAALSAGLTPETNVQNESDYWNRKRGEAGMGAFTGGGISAVAPVLGYAANKVKNIFSAINDDLPLNIRTWASDLKAKAGDNPGNALRSDLAKQYADTRAEAAAPFQELRSLDAQNAPSGKNPNITIHDSTSYRGVRQGPLMGPNDEMMVARDQSGKDVGKLWIEKDPEGGFIVHKIEVDPSAQRKGVATSLYQEANNRFGPMTGATDYTPEGKAFFESMSQGKNAESVPLPQYKQALQNQINEVNQSGARVDPRTANILQGYLDAVDQNPEKGWNRALNISSSLNDDINNAMHGQDPNRQLARHLEIIKSSLKDDLNSEGAKYGDKYTAAMKGWQEKIGPWEDPEQGGSILFHAMHNPVPDKMINNLIGKTPDEARIYFNRLSDSGKDTVKSHIVSDMFAKTEGDPLAITKYLDKNKGSIGVFFDGDDKTMIDGLGKLAKYARNTAVPTSMGIGAGAASALGPYAPIAGAWAGKKYLAGPVSKQLFNAFQSDIGQKLLLDAGKLPEGSPQFGQIMQKLYKLSPFAGVAADYALSSPNANIAQPKNQEEYEALPSGTAYQSMSGEWGVKP